MVATHNLSWVRSPVTSGVIPGWEETIWSIEVMALGLVSEVFLIDMIECLPLFFHGLLWGFPNIWVTQEGSFMILLRFFVNTPLLDIPMGDLKNQWFILWLQTRSYLLSCPGSSLVDHSLAMSSLVSFSPITYSSTYSRLVGI